MSDPKMIKEIKNLDADIVISTRVLFTKWLSQYGSSNIIKIAQEHRHHNNDQKYINKVINACKNIDYLMPVSEELTKFYTKLLKGYRTKCIFIPQALDYIPKVNSKLDKKSIISIGRLSKEKGFVTLINIFKLVNDKYPDWNLNIIGDGIERQNIEERIKIHNLEGKIIMHGYRDRKYIEEELLNSSIYVMTSFEESFGLVLLESQSYGIPCIAFDCAKGATEIIKNNENGYLIKDRNIEDMAIKISKLIDDKNINNSQFLRKYGAFEIAYHEVGIVNDCNPFYLIILTQKYPVKDKDKFINKTAKKIYKIHQKIYHGCYL
jgi:glycosyltransferase involved in cell wall biosynthesis